ncbi:MAG: hypothetical protein U0169_23530 [Polyangiaceae bacterium]
MGRVSRSGVRAGSFGVAAVVLVAVGTACGTPPATGILVELSSQLPLGTVVLRVSNEDGSVAACETYSIAKTPQEESSKVVWPASLGIQPADSKAAKKRVRIEAFAYADDAPAGVCEPGSVPSALVRSEAIVSYVEKSTLRLPMPFTLACVNVPCARGSTCKAGRCVSSAREGESTGAGASAKDCFDTSACTEAKYLEALPGTCLYPLSPDFDENRAAPFVRFALPSEGLSGAEFLASEDYDYGGGTLELKDATCDLVRAGKVVQVGYGAPCAPLGNRSTCGIPWAAAFPERLGDAGADSASQPDAGEDAATGTPDAGMDATLPDATVPDGTTPDTSSPDGSDAGDVLPLAPEAVDDGRTALPPPAVPTGRCDATCCGTCDRTTCTKLPFYTLDMSLPRPGDYVGTDDSVLLVTTVTGTLDVVAFPVPAPDVINLPETLTPAGFAGPVAVARSGASAVVASFAGGAATAYVFTRRVLEGTYVSPRANHAALLAADETALYVLRPDDVDGTWTVERMPRRTGSVPADAVTASLKLPPAFVSPALTPMEMSASSGRVVVRSSSNSGADAFAVADFRVGTSTVVPTPSASSSAIAAWSLSGRTLAVHRASSESFAVRVDGAGHVGSSFGDGSMGTLTTMAALPTTTGVPYVVVGSDSDPADRSKGRISFVPLLAGATTSYRAPYVLQGGEATRVTNLQSSGRCVFAVDTTRHELPLYGNWNPYAP